MKLATLVRGGILGGVAAAVLLASTGTLLGVTLPPWNWSSMMTDSYGRVTEWSRAAVILVAVGIVVGPLIALMCAAVFEYVAQRAGWWVGALVGFAAGVCGAAIVGLVPWFASWYSFAYMPSLAPLGTADPAIALAALAAAGVVVGAVAGATYGRPRHALHAPRTIRWREIYPRPDARR